MKLTHPPDIVSRLKNSHIILDTNTFIHSIDNSDFYNLLVELKESGCDLLTIPSVVFEFARGASSIVELNWYIDYVNNLGVGVYSEKDMIKNDKAFLVLLQKECRKGKNGTGYTDFLLMMLLNKFSHLEDRCFLMTGNHKDIPTTIFDRTEIIALEFRGEVSTQALYKNSLKKVSKMLDVTSS